jgi:hypothetical protein
MSSPLPCLFGYLAVWPSVRLSVARPQFQTPLSQ